MRTHFAYLSLFLLNCPTWSLAASCQASNEVGDSCSIDCPVGQSAECNNANGASKPECRCTGDAIFESLNFSRNLPDNVVNSVISKTDILMVVNSRLLALGDYKLRRECSSQQVGRGCSREPCIVSEKPIAIPSLVESGLMHWCPPRTCEPIYKQVCREVSGKLTVSLPLSIVAGPEVKVEEPNWQGIPTEILGLRESYFNCSSAEQTVTFAHNEEIEIGSRVIKRKTINTGFDVSAEITFLFEGGSGKIGTKFSRNISVSDEKEENFREKKTYSFTLPLRVPPKKVVVMEHTWIRRDVPVEFAGTATIDAPISANLQSILALSQVLPDASDRTFEFSGTVDDASVRVGETRVYERDPTDEECKSEVPYRLAEPFN